MNIHYKKIRQVRITGPMEESREMINWVYDHGYRLIYRGPVISKHTAKDRFVVIAEKEV